MSNRKPGELKKQSCMCCRRTLEPVKIQWAAGPVCLPCYWAAKFYFENGYEDFSQIPPEFAQMLGGLFSKQGYLYPDSLIEAFTVKAFKKASVMRLRWWNPKYHVDEEQDLAEGTEVSQIHSQGNLSW